jgi:hypothetical protein
MPQRTTRRQQLKILGRAERLPASAVGTSGFDTRNREGASGLDRRDLDAAWQPAHTALKVPLNGHQQQQVRMTHALRPTARLIGGSHARPEAGPTEIIQSWLMEVD